MKKQAKKHGFTLAETLITLAIIGVCAAMLITTIKNINPTEASNLVMARKAVGTFTEATRQVLLFNSQTKKMDNLASGGTACASAQCLTQLYGKYLQISRMSATNPTPDAQLGGTYYGELIDGLLFGIEYNKGCALHEGETVQVLPPDEGMVSEVVVSGACAMIYYDVNGVKGPNRVGTDRFVIPVRKSGVKMSAKATAQSNDDGPGGIF